MSSILRKACSNMDETALCVVVSYAPPQGRPSCFQIEHRAHASKAALMWKALYCGLDSTAVSSNESMSRRAVVYGEAPVVERADGPSETRRLTMSAVVQAKAEPSI